MPDYPMETAKTMLEVLTEQRTQETKNSAERVKAALSRENREKIQKIIEQEKKKSK